MISRGILTETVYSRPNTLQLYGTQLLEPGLAEDVMIPEEDVFTSVSPRQTGQLTHRNLIQYDSIFMPRSDFSFLAPLPVAGDQPVIWESEISYCFCPFAQCPTDKGIR